MKYLKHASKMLTKTPEKTLKLLQTYTTSIKHLQNMCETYATSR
jgi:hypothetical protein